MNYINLDKTASWGKLRGLASKGEKFELTANLVMERSIPMGGGLTYNWAAKMVGDEVAKALQELADEQKLIEKYHALLKGEIMNTGEKRKVLHHLLRSGTKTATGLSVVEGDRDLGEFYAAQLGRVYAFADRVRSGELAPAPGRRYTAFCQIGIGGSDLGPRALSLALANWAAAEGKTAYRTEFISNVDPDDPSAVLASLPLDRTLFVLVSKSGITQETLTNERFVKEKLKAADLNPARHMVAVTSETSPLAGNPDYLDSFYFDDNIGGRYSSCSPVGGVILSLAYGPEVFRALLAGAAEADRAALESCICKNAALLDACIGVWERNFRGCPCTAVLPYSQALSRFPAHLQQLDMESNGKRVNREGEPVAYPTGPVVFGEPGTNGQHSFFQLLHQGTDIVPLQFVGFRQGQRGDDIVSEGSTSQSKLGANLAAQITAFAMGQESENGNRHFPGGRPSSLICGDRLTPEALGALLAHYENKVMFQGFVWNLNSFDQEGVQLGKKLAGKLLSGAKGKSGDPVLDAYAEILGV